MKPILSQRIHAREALYLKLMIKSLLIALLALCTSFSAEADSTFVKLSVIDAETNETLPFATVAVFQNGVQVATATTDLDGRCEFRNLASGQYDFRAVYIGYQAQEVKKVPLFAQKTNWLNIKLKTGYRLTCCCTCYCFDDRSENWWPKLWTPYREMYKEWKEKKERKKALAAKQTPKQKNILSEEPDEQGIADSIETARVELVEEMTKEIKIYPNPVSDVLHIEAAQVVQNLSIKDASGKTLKEETMQGPRADINLNGFAAGIYYLNYVVNGKSDSRSIVVVAP